MTTVPAPREERHAVLDLVLLRIEALEDEAQALRGMVQRMRRSLSVGVSSVLPPTGSPLAARRLLLRLSQAQAGREAGLSRSQVQALEAGTRPGKAGGTMAAYVAALERLEATR